MNTNDRVLVTVEEAVRITGVSRSALYKIMGEGRLPFRLLAGKRRIHVADLKTFAQI